MKRIAVFFLTTALVFTLFTGCSKPAPTAPEVPAAVPAETPAASEAPAAEELTDKDGLLKLMAGGQDAVKKGISYDYVMTAGEQQVMHSHFSFKGENVRMEGLDPENPTLMITKGKELFIINPNEKTGFKMSTEANAGVNPAGDVKPEENMDKDSLKIVGKEDVNGEPCYVVATRNVVEGYDMKMWVHQKYGIMMKMEGAAPEGKMLIEVKNLKVGDIQDSEFEIPADIKMMEMPTVPQQ